MTASAGYRSVTVSDHETGTSFRTAVFYPSLASELPEVLGPFTESIAREGEIAPGSQTLVVISHGTGSMPMLHRGLAIHLARHGFVVALPEHPGNSRTDDSLAGTKANLLNRPRHLSAVADWAYQSELFHSILMPASLGVIGRSLGGYTALAIAGGRPTAFPWETEGKQAEPIDVTPDARVKALVLLAPAAAWFLEDGALDGVSIPIPMLTGEKDDLEIPGHKTLANGSVVHMPAGHSAIIKSGVRNQELVEHRVIPNAGHYSFKSPYPVGMRTPAVPPSQDPAGFDRVAFYDQMCTDVLGF